MTKCRRFLVYVHSFGSRFPDCTREAFDVKAVAVGGAAFRVD